MKDRGQMAEDKGLRFVLSAITGISILTFLQVSRNPPEFIYWQDERNRSAAVFVLLVQTDFSIKSQYPLKLSF